jgi:hypothetical protein
VYYYYWRREQNWDRPRASPRYRCNLSLVVGHVRRSTAPKWCSADFEAKSPGDCCVHRQFSICSIAVSVFILENYLPAHHGHPNFCFADLFVSDRKNILGENSEISFLPGLQRAEAVFGKTREG